MEHYKLRIGEDLIELNQTDIEKLDIVQSDDLAYHVIYNGVTYHAQLVDEDQNDKTLSIVVNGNRYDFSIEDDLDQLIREMGYSEKKDHKFSELHSPMPGLILDILVTEGQEVEEGEAMLILEAMKMENVLKAPGSGVVKNICLTKGDPVDKNQVIIEME